MLSHNYLCHRRTALMQFQSQHQSLHQSQSQRQRQSQIQSQSQSQSLSLSLGLSLSGVGSVGPQIWRSAATRRAWACSTPSARP